MKNPFPLLVLLLLTSMAAFGADVTGTWSGTVSIKNPDGTVVNAQTMVVLKQTGSEVTGWAGSGENDQNPISKGSIKGDKLTFTVEARNGFTFTADLTVKEDTLSGTAKRNDGQEITLTIAKKTK